MKFRYTLISLSLFCIYNQSTGMEEKQKKQLTPNEFKREVAQTALQITDKDDERLKPFTTYHIEWERYSFQQMVVGLIGSSVIGLGSRNVEQKSPAQYIMYTMGIIGIGCTLYKLKNTINHFWNSYYIRNNKQDNDYLDRVNKIVQFDIYNLLSRAKVEEGQLSPKEYLSKVQYTCSNARGLHFIQTDMSTKKQVKRFIRRIECARFCTLSCPEE